MSKILRHILIASMATVCAFNARAQMIDTMTGTYNDQIKTLQVTLNEDALAPAVMVIDSDDRLTFSFDHLSTEREYLRYELIHCNANWQPSGLVDSEYLNGFNQGDINDYDYSQLTTTHYVHYWLTVPNAQVAPKISGNYVLRIYPENDPDDTWLQYRFMVTEQRAQVKADVTTRTDIDYNRENQQLSIMVDTERADVKDPFNDLIVMVQQNGRYDNEIALRQPMRMQGRYISIYEHMPQLIFQAGNEYRRMECVSTTYPSMGVESVNYMHPYYHMTLYPDASRNDQMYLYDQTQHGRFFIREYNSSQSEIEADYVVVHFTLDMPEEPDALVFLDGDFTNRRFEPNSLMTYNRATGLYERNMLLKQGAYNYQYLLVPNGKNRGYTGPIEGDKYQTSNEYLIKVYSRHPGDRYDRLISVTILNS